MAAGVAAFSAASLLLPAALSGPFAAAGLTVPAILAARACVVSHSSRGGGGLSGVCCGVWVNGIA
jgi:hypothetical protein